MLRRGSSTSNRRKPRAGKSNFWESRLMIATKRLTTYWTSSRVPSVGPPCARIRQRDYDEVMKGRIPPRSDNPYYFLFQALIGLTVTIERLHGESEPMEFIFDSNDRCEKASYSLVNSFYNKDMFRGIINVLYRDDKKFLPLQAADLFAWQSRRFLCANEPRRKHYTRARNAGNRRPHFHIMSRQEITRYITEMRE